MRRVAAREVRRVPTLCEFLHWVGPAAGSKNVPYPAFMRHRFTNLNSARAFVGRGYKPGSRILALSKVTDSVFSTTRIWRRRDNRGLHGFSANFNALSRIGSRLFFKSSIVVCTSMSGFMPAPSNPEPSGK